MSYGVNKWASRPGRARAAGTRSARSTRTAKRKKAASARPARKKSRAKKPARKSRVDISYYTDAELRALKKKPKKAKKTRAKKPKKAKAPKRKKFTRYDPETGRKVSVYEDDYRFDEWPDRKPSKSSKLAAKIREHPVDYALERATKVATARGRTASRSVGRKLSGLVTGGAGAAATLGAAAAAVGIIAAAYVVADQIAKNGRVKLGDRINAISQRFALAQQEIERKYGTTRWDQVPADVRARWLSDYKRALSVANSQAQGTAFAGVRESYK